MSTEPTPATPWEQPAADSRPSALSAGTNNRLRAPRAARLVAARKTRALLAAAALVHASLAAHAQIPRGNIIERNMFQLVSSGTDFSLRLPARDLAMSVPTEWLIPPSAKKDSPGPWGFVYDRRVDSFPIGRGKMGLHVSSFETGEGSMSLGIGRDVFLVLDEKRQLHPGLVDLGETKERYRAQGCFEARSSKFLLADINNDRALDIGVMQEKLHCRQVVRDEVDGVEGPYYEVEPTRWYVFGGDKWSYDATLDGRFPARRPYWRVPLINMTMTTVDFVMSLTRQPR